MVAHGYDDVEGDLLSKVRAIVGPDVPIGAELDPHSHLTDLRFDSADILIAFKEFPHIDVIERAEEVVDYTLKMIRKEMYATPALRCAVFCPALLCALLCPVTPACLSVPAAVISSKPVMAKFDCRMIEVLPTSTQPMRGFADRMMAMEGHSELSELSEIDTHVPGETPPINYQRDTLPR